MNAKFHGRAENGQRTRGSDNRGVFKEIFEIFRPLALVLPHDTGRVKFGNTGQIKEMNLEMNF